MTPRERRQIVDDFQDRIRANIAAAKAAGLRYNVLADTATSGLEPAPPGIADAETSGLDCAELIYPDAPKTTVPEEPKAARLRREGILSEVDYYRRIGVHVTASGQILL